jgi:hypothetical protein
MPKSPRGIITRPTLPEPLIAALPKTLTAEWKKVMTAYDKAQEAHQQSARANQTADVATVKDAEAAKEAIRAGKPLPPETATGAEATAREKQREAEALDEIALEVEARFLTALRLARPEIADTVRARVIDAITAAETALTAATTAADDVAVMAGLWVWARSDSNSNPTIKPLSLADQPLTSWMERAAKALRAENPDVVEAKEAELHAEWERSTPDGVILPSWAR